jgi:quercetin 2,3-dioxygenase
MRVSHRQLAFGNPFPGLRGVDLMAESLPIEPFLVVTEFHMDRPVFGPHPHAGISVMTYVLPDSAGSFFNRDGQGDFSRIEPGGLHITQAGRGIHHDEFPVENGVDVHGFQIWINHREQDRWVTPRALHADAHEVPEVRQPDAVVRVLHGTYGDVSARHQLVTPVTLLHIIAGPGARVALPGASMTFAYGLRGAAHHAGYALTAQALITVADTAEQVVDVGHEGAEWLYGAGTPLREPIQYGGPFVMTTLDQMAETRRRYARGEMGSLAPFRDAPANRPRGS